MNSDKIKIDISKFPKDSSLGLLAYGDVAFKAWRELKKEINRKNEDEQKNE